MHSRCFGLPLKTSDQNQPLASMAAGVSGVCLDVLCTGPLGIVWRLDGQAATGSAKGLLSLLKGEGAGMQLTSCINLQDVNTGAGRRSCKSPGTTPRARPRRRLRASAWESGAPENNAAQRLSRRRYFSAQVDRPVRSSSLRAGCDMWEVQASRGCDFGNGKSRLPQPSRRPRNSGSDLQAWEGVTDRM